MSVCTDVSMCISFLFTSTLVVGDLKGVLHNLSTIPRASPRFTWYTRISYVELLTHNTYLVYTECAPPVLPPMIWGTFMYICLTYFWYNKFYLIYLKIKRCDFVKNFFVFILIINDSVVKTVPEYCRRKQHWLWKTYFLLKEKRTVLKILCIIFIVDKKWPGPKNI